MSSKFRITIVTDLDPLVTVHVKCDTRIIFNKLRGGMYYFDTPNEAFDKNQTTDYTFLSTVESKKSCFHRHEINEPDKLRILQ